MDDIQNQLNIEILDDRESMSFSEKLEAEQSPAKIKKRVTIVENVKQSVTDNSFTDLDQEPLSNIDLQM